MRCLLLAFAICGGLAGCSSNDVYETVTVSIRDIRCSENVRFNYNQNGLSAGVRGISIGPSTSPHGSAHIGLSMALSDGKSNVQQRCKSILETASQAAVLERQRMQADLELLRLKAAYERLRIEREKIAIKQNAFPGTF